jgi:hypothetical protein
MNCLACFCGFFLFLGFAPLPIETEDSDPDKAIQQFERDVKGKDEEAFDTARKKLIAMLKKRQAKLEKRGKSEKAEAIRTRLVLLESLSPEHLLGKVKVTDLLKKAANGKYAHLQRVLLVPSDQANYMQFSDFGFWNGTGYMGFNDLPAGYWIYVYPRWFIWRDGPRS